MYQTFLTIVETRVKDEDVSSASFISTPIAFSLDSTVSTVKAVNKRIHEALNVRDIAWLLNLVFLQICRILRYYKVHELR